MPSARYAHAHFADSIARLAQLPPERGHEVAFAGRSNAGKSSALNAITGRSGLARTSKTPGRTQLINLFELGDDRRLVDLPGYGYARAPEATRRRWERLIGDYLEQRTVLVGVMLVLDIRRGLTDLDRRLLALVVPTGVPLHALVTKADKLKRGQAARQLESIRRELGDAGVEASLQLFSAATGAGVDDVHGVLDDWLAWGAPSNTG